MSKVAIFKMIAPGEMAMRSPRVVDLAIYLSGVSRGPKYTVSPNSTSTPSLYPTIDTNELTRSLGPSSTVKKFRFLSLKDLRNSKSHIPCVDAILMELV
jgi:hypothetical protein